MRRCIRSFVVALASIASLACAATINTTSQAALGEAPKHYPRLAVMAGTSDMRLRIKAESSFVRAARKAGIEMVPWHSLFFAGRTLSDSEMVRTLQAHQIPAVLLLTDATTDAPTVIASAKSNASCTFTSNGRCTDISSSGEASQETRQDKFSINSRVVAIPSEATVWMGATRIVRLIATDDVLIDRLARDVVRTLVVDGVVIDVKASR